MSTPVPRHTTVDLNPSEHLEFAPLTLVAAGPEQLIGEAAPVSAGEPVDMAGMPSFEMPKEPDASDWWVRTLASTRLTLRLFRGVARFRRHLPEYRVRVALTVGGTRDQLVASARLLHRALAPVLRTVRQPPDGGE